MSFVWDLNAYKQMYLDLQFDLFQLPIGMLSQDKIKRSNLILSEIAKALNRNADTLGK